MEHSLICEVENKLPDTIWHLGESFYINDKDGRNN